MKFTISNAVTGLNVAEYEADAPVQPHTIDPAYNGPQFVTKNEQGDVVDITSNFRTWTILEFKRRLTQPERVAIRTAAKSNPVVEDFMDLLDAAAEVRSDDPDLIAGLGLLEQAGLLAEGRADQIMNGA